MQTKANLQDLFLLRAGDEVIITAYDLYDGKVIGS